MSMKRKLLGLSAVAVLAAGVVTTGVLGRTSDGPPLDGTVAQFSPQVPPAPAPEAGFEDGQGHQMDLSAFRGKVALVNLWATWCAPCVKELPALLRLKQAHDGADFVVVTISEDRQGAKAVDPFLEKNGWTGLTHYVDQPGAVARALGVRGLPTTLLLGPDGKELGRMEGGAEWDDADAVRLIDWYRTHTKPVESAAKP
jgi:thiol-disulfide isomerase/thioredoxin